MFRKLLPTIVLAALWATAADAAPDKYNFDKDHTHIIFFIEHEGFSNMIGRMREFDGVFYFDEKEPDKSKVDVTIKAASIATDVPELDKALIGQKFLNTGKFPTIHFKSTHVVLTAQHRADVTGDFTLLGVTKPLVLHVKYNKSGIHPFTNNYVSGFSADATFNRSDFGMKAYIPDVGDEVRVHIEIEATDPLKHPGNSKAPH